MKKGQICEGVVEKVIFPNKGMVIADGERAVVKNAIPGQTIRFAVNKIRKGKCEGRLLEVLKPSPMEIDAACGHYGLCGGCNYQTLPYEEQLKIKEGQVKELLDSVCEDYEFEGILGSPKQFGYRNKMEFSFGDEVKDGPLALGMHRRGSFYDIVTVDGCRIVDEDFRKILRWSLDVFREEGTQFYHKMSHSGCLRHLLVRKGVKTGEILVDLVTASGDVAGIGKWKEGLLKIERDGELEGRIAGILHTVNESVADVIRDDGTDVLYGQDYFYEELLGMKFKISPFSFFQTNSLGAEVLYEKAREYVGETKDKVIFDLYSGTGTIAQMMAPVAKKVIGVEIVEEAVEAAKVNARLNGLENCEFIAGDVLKVVDEIAEKPDLIVLDPPRDGIHPRALEKIIDFGVERLVYISCKPSSLVRDLVVLQERGYRVVKAGGVDMFPGTVHVESVIMMQNCGFKKK